MNRIHKVAVLRTNLHRLRLRRVQHSLQIIGIGTRVLMERT